MTNKQRYQYTKKQIQGVVHYWDDCNTDEIAEKLGLEPQQIVYLAKQIRDAGYDLPKKKRKNIVKSLIVEALREIGKFND